MLIGVQETKPVFTVHLAHAKRLAVVIDKNEIQVGSIVWHLLVFYQMRA